MCKQEKIKGLTVHQKARIHNPTRTALEKILSVLNKTKYSLCFSSGLGAITAVAAGLLKCGDHIVCTDDVYGGTSRLFYEMLPPLGIKTSFVDFCDMKNVEEAITPRTKLIWTENPTNPKLKVIDMCRTVEAARSHNIMVAVDSTFLTPYLQTPIDYGVDIVVHSLTKYMNGHSDVIMGCVCTTNDDIYRKLKYVQEYFGHVASPFDCSQVIRGIKTLPYRMRRHQKSSLEIAKYLMGHPKIESVIHPGMPCHPQHELFKSQCSGHSGMIAFYLKGGLAESQKFLASIKTLTHAVSLGGYESLVQLPCHSSHKTVPDDMKKKLGYTDTLVRLSVGLEDVQDIIADFEQALGKI
nr:putative cystathionine gamma-lyase 2 [Leptinotarsa decemlineata]